MQGSVHVAPSPLRAALRASLPLLALVWVVLAAARVQGPADAARPYELSYLAATLVGFALLLFAALRPRRALLAAGVVVVALAWIPLALDRARVVAAHPSAVENVMSFAAVNFVGALLTMAPYLLLLWLERGRTEPAAAA